MHPSAERRVRPPSGRNSVPKQHLGSRLAGYHGANGGHGPADAVGVIDAPAERCAAAHKSFNPITTSATDWIRLKPDKLTLSLAP